MKTWVATVAGVPTAGLTPTFLQYVDRTGSAVTPPSIIDLGGGLYGFKPSAVDTIAGVAWLVDNGVSVDDSTRFYEGLVYQYIYPFAAITLRDPATGNVYSGVGVPTVTSYVDSAGNARTPPALKQASAYFYVLNPTRSDVLAGSSYLVTSPVDATPPYWAGGLGDTLRSPTNTTGVKPERRAVEYLRDWLLLQLPAKVAELNADRAAFIRTTTGGPFVIPAGYFPKVAFNAVNIDENPTDFTTYAPAAGTLTSAQLEAAFNNPYVSGQTTTVGGHAPYGDGNPNHYWLDDRSHLGFNASSVVLTDQNGTVDPTHYTANTASGYFDFTGHAAPTGAVTAAYTYPGTTIATVDDDGRVVITDPNPPSESTDRVSIVTIAPDTTGGHTALGWDEGGEKERRSPLYAPTRSAVMDGWPQTPVAQIGQGFVAVISKRDGKPWGEVLRRDEYLVQLEVALFHFVDAAEAGLGREHMHAVLQAVREVLFTERGRRLGRDAEGDIALTLDVGGGVAERPFKWLDAGAPNTLFDVAFLNLSVRVFERPALS